MMLPRVGVYTITSTATGKVYVGGSRHMTNRFGYHRWALRQGTHTSTEFQKEFDQHGMDNLVFAIAEPCSLLELRQVEQKWMNSLGDKLLNREHLSTRKGAKHTVETRDKISVSAKRVSNTEEQRHMRSERAKRQHAEGNFGRPT